MIQSYWFFDIVEITHNNLYVSGTSCVLKLHAMCQKMLLVVIVDFYCLFYCSWGVNHLFLNKFYESTQFSHLYTFSVLRYCNEREKGALGSKDGATKLANQLINVRALISHLQPKIAQLGDASLTEEQVRESGEVFLMKSEIVTNFSISCSASQSGIF